jgi:hypothetical protein
MYLVIKKVKKGSVKGKTTLPKFLIFSYPS